MSNIHSAIDSMVSQSAATSGIALAQTTQNMQLGNDGTVSLIGPAVAPSQVDVPPNYSAVTDVHALAAEITRITNELSEGEFNSKGERVGDKFNGRDRDIRNAQLASLQGSLDYAMQRGLQLVDAQAAKTAERDRTMAEQVAAFEYHRGNPAKAEQLAREIEAAEARRVAEAIVSRRRA
jgi:hypothetical protein